MDIYRAINDGGFLIYDSDENYLGNICTSGAKSALKMDGLVYDIKVSEKKVTGFTKISVTVKETPESFEQKSVREWHYDSTGYDNYTVQTYCEKIEASTKVTIKIGNKDYTDGLLKILEQIYDINDDFDIYVKAIKI